MIILYNSSIVITIILISLFLIDIHGQTPEPTFSPTAFFPTQAPVPTSAPVPTTRPSAIPTTRPTSFTFSGSGSIKYIQMTTVLNVQLTRQTAYTTYNLPAITTELMSDSVLAWMSVSELSMHYSSTTLIDSNSLSWTLDVYYNSYIPLNGRWSAYVSQPINLFKEIKSNFSYYASGTGRSCCLSDLVQTYYLAAGTPYNASIARTFFFQTIDFYNPTGVLVDPTNAPTAVPTSSPKPTTSRSPTTSPTLSSAPVAISSSSTSSSSTAITTTVLIIIIIIVIGFACGLSCLTLYFLYATQRLCCKLTCLCLALGYIGIHIERNVDEDDEQDEDDDDVAAAEAVVIDGDHSEKLKEKEAKEMLGSVEPAQQVDEWTAAMNNFGSWLGVPPSDKPVLNLVDLNSAWDSWLGNPTAVPANVNENNSPRRKRRSDAPGQGSPSSRQYPPGRGPPGRGRGPPPNRNPNANPNAISNQVIPDWNLDNISAWLTGAAPEQPRGPTNGGRTGGRGPPPPGYVPRGPPSNGIPPNGVPGIGPQLSLSMPGAARGPPPPGYIPGRGPPPPGYVAGRGPPPPGYIPGRGPPPPGYIPGRGPPPPGYVQGRGPPPPGYAPGRAPPRGPPSNAQTQADQASAMDWGVQMGSWLSLPTNSESKV